MQLAIPLRAAPRNPYLSLAVAAIQRAVAYRNATVLTMLTNVAWLAVVYYVWRAVFQGQDRVGSFDWPAMRTYVVVAYAINALLSFATEQRLFGAVFDGSIALHLVRPVDFLTAQLADALGVAAVEGTVSGAIAVVFGVLLFHAAPPVSPVMFAVFLLSVALAFVVKFFISYLFVLLSFYTVNTLGLLRVRSALTALLSGALVPLEFLPAPLQVAAAYAPFRAIVHTPVAIYLGHVTGGAVLNSILTQVAWAVILWLLVRLMWSRSLRALTIQGG